MHAEVLVVEDNELVREMCEAVLTGSGWVVHTAACVDDALEVLHVHPAITVLVTDLSLPGDRNGLDLIAVVQATWPALRVVLSTGHLERPNELPAEVGVLIKPFPLAALLEAVGEPTPRSS